MHATSCTPSHSCVCRLLSRTNDYELRLYDVYPYISTPYERRDEGYLALGAYMDGQNTESAQMNSTQPIVMRYEPATVSLLCAFLLQMHESTFCYQPSMTPQCAAVPAVMIAVHKSMCRS